MVNGRLPSDVSLHKKPVKYVLHYGTDVIRLPDDLSHVVGSYPPCSVNK